jgi:heme exporter protein B
VNPLRAAVTIAAKDLRIEWRHRTAFLSAIVFAVLVLLVFVFAHDSGDGALATIAPTVLWVMLPLATIVALNRGFTLEREHAALDAILLAPVSATALFWGKWLANTILVVVVELVAIPAWMLFFDIVPGAGVFAIAAIALVTTVGLTAAGTLFSAMAVRTRFAELLLPVMLLPFFIPPLFFASQATVRILAERPFGEVGGWLMLLALYDLAFFVLATLLFPLMMDQ